LRILPGDFLYRYKAILEIPLTAEGRKEVVRELQTITDEIEILANIVTSAEARVRGS